MLDARRQLDADVTELHTKRDLLPPEGWQRLRREAVAEARERATAGDRAAERALDALKAALTAAALPQVDVQREQLARDELRLALEGGAPVGRVADIAGRGSREAVAVLFSGYGRTLLEARGLTGRDLEDALATARTVAANAAIDRATTPREILAGAALRALGKLGAAKGAAGVAFLQLADQAER